MNLGDVPTSRGDFPAAISARLMAELEHLAGDADLHLWNGPHLVIDWDTFEPTTGDDRTLVIHVRSADYYWTLLGHSGIAPRIREHLDQYISTCDDIPFADIGGFVQHLRNEGANQLAQRRSPLGVSLGIFARDENGEFGSVVVGRRSSMVAVNPDVWTFPVDENVEWSGEKAQVASPSGSLISGCATELGWDSKDPRLPRMVLSGVHVPDGSGEAGRATGVTIVYELEVSQGEIEGLLTAVRSNDEMVSDREGAYGGDTRAFIDQTPADTIAQPLLGWMHHRLNQNRVADEDIAP